MGGGVYAFGVNVGGDVVGFEVSGIVGGEGLPEVAICGLQEGVVGVGFHQGVFREAALLACECTQVTQADGVGGVLRNECLAEAEQRERQDEGGDDCDRCGDDAAGGSRRRTHRNF